MLLRVVLPRLFLGHALRTIDVCLEAILFLALQRVNVTLESHNTNYSNYNHHYGEEPNDRLPQLPLESRVSDVLPLDLIR